MIEQLLRGILFQQDPERAHEWSLQALELLSRMPRTRAHLWPAAPLDPLLRQTLWGLDFAHPLGLAAGFDKDARALPALSAMGFGFLEIGTVTPRPQMGNPQPRLFRYPSERAVINRLGFPSVGMELVEKNLRGAGTLPVPLGINLGKNKDTPLEEAIEDYAQVLRCLAPYADYLVVNVSSPNTPGLRQLQQLEHLRPLLQHLRELRQELPTKRTQVPLLLKIAPDLDDADIAALGELAREESPLLDGFIAGNTTLSRPSDWQPAEQTGGLSGVPLRDLATQVLAKLYRESHGALPIIGVGGIFSAEDAYAKILAGASLVQVYSGWIWGGSAMLHAFPGELTALLRRDGFSSISAAVGQESR
ncbi:quinone-dependent dihydroorotate dehydrogenase [Acidithiobacillus sp. IBUN Pt1247-S3]|uniref:quinone-dependent dihydroorotate dehydrogenase n=1 Tax=Acidithiobacillus sp. IBUN Pt1247-S3 TaxID=3166642 RepID=UPI0034E5EDE1